MSRRSQRRRRQNRSSAKPLTFANPPRLLRPIVSHGALPHPGTHLAQTFLREVEDRRDYHPLGRFRAARQLSGHPVERNVIKPTRLNKARPFLAHSVPIGIKFKAPKKTALCVRREQRKEVLFAKKKTRAGSRGKKHRNWYSSISCR